MAYFAFYPNQSFLQAKRKAIAALALGLLAIPAIAWANAGTPLMWAGAIHLLIGNALIGLIEAGLLILLFRLPKGRTLCIMIAANYFSAWVSAFFFIKPTASLFRLDLNNAWVYYWTMVCLTYLLTLILEFPFVALAFQEKPGWVAKSIRASFVVQTTSYLLLFGWFWILSGTSLYTQNRIVDLAMLSPPQDVVVYFISSSDGDVYARGLSSSGETKVFDLNSRNLDDRLFVRKSSSDPNRWDLLARLSQDQQSPQVVLLKESVASDAAPSWQSSQGNAEPGSWFNFGIVPKLGAARHSRWEFTSGFWPLGGLSGDKDSGDKWASISLETPFVAWMVRNATHLPLDEVLFQLDSDQICLYDVEKKEVALVTHGRGPVVVIRDVPASETVVR